MNPLHQAADRFLERCRRCLHGSPSARCAFAAQGGFREFRPRDLNFAATRVRQNLPVAWRRVTLALVEPCPGFEEDSNG